MKTVIKSSILVASVVLAACAPKDAKLKAAPKPPKPKPAPVVIAPVVVTDRAKVSNQYESPKVDILFVIDNSKSMAPHQANLVANIDKFADAFIKNTDVDFHVGVVKVFDSVTFKDAVPNGHLINGFVSRSADTVSDLKKLLNIGVLPPNDANPAAGGPVIEEIFSPIVAALSEDNLKGVNAGFYRPEAHLAIILVTDANDASPNVDETNLEAFLFRLKNKRPEKYSTYGVLSFGKKADGTPCPVDPSGNPARVNNLIEKTNGHKFSLCDASFGRKLGKVGSDIAAKAVFKRVVDLLNVPSEKHPIVVKCQGEEVPADEVNFDKRALTVSISSTYQKCRNDNDEIEVSYVLQESDKLDIEKADQ